MLKYSSEAGLIATLKDHEDKEITIENLVDAYYSHPENYFECQGNPIEAWQSSSNFSNDDNNGSAIELKNLTINGDDNRQSGINPNNP